MRGAGMKRSVGRPRRYSDEAIFAAIHQIIVTEGYERLTLNRLAQAIGSTAPAVLKRFGSRRDLLWAYIGWCTARSQQHLATLPTDRAPLDRLTGYLLPQSNNGATAPPAGTLPHLAGPILDAGPDPLMRTALQEHVTVVATTTQQLLDEAIAAGELERVDTVPLARRLLETVTGAAMLIELEARSSGGAPSRTLGEVVSDVLAPYRIGSG